MSQPISSQSKAFQERPARIGTLGASVPPTAPPTTSATKGTTTMTPTSSTAAATMTNKNGSSHTQADLDEATLDLLKLSTEPTKVSYSANPRISPNADKLPKAASTSSMHKVIRTKVSQISRRRRVGKSCFIGRFDELLKSHFFASCFLFHPNIILSFNY